jgi:hypothetical protein
LKPDKDKPGVGIEILPPDMAYPLVIMAFVLLGAFVFGLMPENNITYFIQIFLVLYGLAMAFELVTFIFFVTTRSIYEEAKEERQKEEHPHERSGAQIDSDKKTDKIDVVENDRTRH